MAEQGRDEELDIQILNSPSTDHKVLEAMTTATLSPELYDLSMVSLQSAQSNFIAIGWLYLVRIEEIHV